MIVRIFRAFARRKLEFNHFASSSLTRSRYFRLMAITMCNIMFTIPLAVFIICGYTTAAPIYPWESWGKIHFNYGHIDQRPATIWRSNHLVAACIEVTRWSGPLSALAFFTFFGFADEARKNYRLSFHWILKRTCRSRIEDLRFVLLRFQL